MDITLAQTAVLAAIITSAKTMVVCDPGWNTDEGRIPDSTRLRPVGLAMVSVANLRLWGHDPVTIAELEEMKLIQRWSPSNPEIAVVLARWGPPGGDCITLSPLGAENAGVVIDEHVETVQILEPDNDPAEGRWATVLRSYPHEVPEWRLVRRRPPKVPRWGREYAMPQPEKIVDKRTEGRYLADFETGEETADERKAVKLFPGRNIVVTIDPRIKGKGATTPKPKKPKPAKKPAPAPSILTDKPGATSPGSGVGELLAADLAAQDGKRTRKAGRGRKGRRT